MAYKNQHLLRKQMPIQGSLFTAYATEPRKEGGDLRIKCFANWTGYVKPNSTYYSHEVKPNDYFRFLIVSVHQHVRHNYFQVIPFRPVMEGEDLRNNILEPNDFEKIRKLRTTFYEEMHNLSLG